MNKAHILVIDDEPQIRKLLQIALESNGYEVTLAATAREGIAQVAQHTPDLVLLDIVLPDMNGHDTLKELRSWYSRAIIMLSVISQEKDIVAALDAGANDYLTKPFRTGELLARIRSSIRHNVQEDSSGIYESGNLTLNLISRTITHHGNLLKLTSTEYKLLALMMQNEGKVLTHQLLLREVWGMGYQQETQYLRVYVAQLRKKIEVDPNQPNHIVTESGVGYRFVSE